MIARFSTIFTTERFKIHTEKHPKSHDFLAINLIKVLLVSEFIKFII